MQTASVMEPDELAVLIVDDHPIFVDGLCMVLSGKFNADITRVGCLKEAKELLSQRANFDLIIIDLSLPDGSGLNLLRHVHQSKLFIPCIVLSASEEASDVRSAIRCGASGFICKSSGSQSILGGVQTVLDGKRALPSFVNYDEMMASDASCNLTERQTQVLKLLAKGLPNKAICQELNLTEHTVKSHLKNLFEALDAHTRTECVHKAQQMGLIDSQ